MTKQGKPITANPKNRSRAILMADDDLDYHLIVKCALEEVGFTGVLEGVRDGVELMDFLFRRGKYKEAAAPDLIILDLNMPGTDGRIALHDIKADPSLSKIPIAVLTSFFSEEDIELCSQFRDCTCVVKPATFQEWTRIIGEFLRANLPS